MFKGKNNWTSEYSAVVQAQTVEYILADTFDNTFIADLKATFEKCVRTDSGNTITEPFNLSNQKIINLGAPSSDTDAATLKSVKDAVYKYEAIRNETNSVSGNYTFPGYSDGITQFSMEQGGAITFVLPAVSNKNVVNQIMVDIKTNSAGNAINVGTNKYFDRRAPEFAANNYYTIIWEYSNRLQAWVVGVLNKGTAA